MSPQVQPCTLCTAFDAFLVAFDAFLVAFDASSGVLTCLVMLLCDG